MNHVIISAADMTILPISETNLLRISVLFWLLFFMEYAIVMNETMIKRRHRNWKTIA